MVIALAALIYSIAMQLSIFNLCPTIYIDHTSLYMVDRMTGGHGLPAGVLGRWTYSYTDHIDNAGIALSWRSWHDNRRTLVLEGEVEDHIG